MQLQQVPSLWMSVASSLAIARETDVQVHVQIYCFGLLKDENQLEDENALHDIQVVFASVLYS